MCQGYSSLAVALVLPEGGQLVACERDAKSLEVAQRYYDRAGVSEKVCWWIALFDVSGLVLLVTTPLLLLALILPIMTKVACLLEDLRLLTYLISIYDS